VGLRHDSAKPRKETFGLTSKTREKGLILKAPSARQSKSRQLKDFGDKDCSKISIWRELFFWRSDSTSRDVR
jgi:hypothetical protein